jgi:hypothetical protein
LVVSQENLYSVEKPTHLPECPQFCDGKPPKCRGGDCTLCDEVDCYCERLRACEQRVLDRVRADERKRAVFIAQHSIEDSYCREDAIAWINGVTPKWWTGNQP